MGIDPYANCNTTITDNEFCTLDTCCLAQGVAFLYLPTYGGNLFFTIFFGLAIVPNLYFGIRHVSLKHSGSFML